MTLYCALVHHPVLNRKREVITTAVTNIDVHDFARMSRTYELGQCFIVTPITAQQQLVERIASHWRTGPGKERVPTRSQAFSILSCADSVDAASEWITEREGARPTWVATAAASRDRETLGVAEVREMQRKGPVLLLFGTGHGLTDEILAQCDAQLPPIRPKRQPTDFNHLSVRTAAAITLDRVLGDGDAPQD